MLSVSHVTHDKCKGKYKIAAFSIEIIFSFFRFLKFSYVLKKEPQTLVPILSCPAPKPNFLVITLKRWRQMCKCEILKALIVRGHIFTPLKFSRMNNEHWGYNIADSPEKELSWEKANKMTFSLCCCAWLQ